MLRHIDFPSSSNSSHSSLIPQIVDSMPVKIAKAIYSLGGTRVRLLYTNTVVALHFVLGFLSLALVLVLGSTSWALVCCGWHQSLRVHTGRLWHVFAFVVVHGFAHCEHLCGWCYIPGQWFSECVGTVRRWWSVPTFSTAGK